MKRYMLVVSLLIMGCLWSAEAQIDGKTQLYRNDPKGDRQYQAKGTLDGNRVRSLYWNTTELAQWKNPPAGEWPKGSGHNYIDGVGILIGAKIYLPNGKAITPIESHYREESDADPTNPLLLWDLEPVPGYFNTTPPNDMFGNPRAPKPAVNVDPTSWPAQWPLALRADGRTTADWDGYWYGYFGRGVMNSDFETFFVVDDSKDAEFTRPPYNYFPIAADSNRGGLGIRVETRGFQWSHVLAEDVIFWHFDIVNISDHNYDTCAFGFLSDPGVGAAGDGSEPSNSAYFKKAYDICYAFAPGGVGYPTNWKTGYYGYAFLESPGNPWDGLDNDNDGMIDEARDNNIDDNHNWSPFTDLNGNGRWDVGEPLNDDVGADGVGPFDLQYNGPDAGEGDGQPTHGEPNFDETDKDESDQIGLTAVALNPLGDKTPTGVWPKNDDVVWKRMNFGFADSLVENANITIVFASGTFPLQQNHRERFSMALLFGLDLNALLFSKVTVQNIYNANYNFSKPPFTPKLTAVAGDRRVYLYWDDRAEKSRDPYLGNKLDFEGYLIYRSSDAEFNDIKLITDSQGNPRYWKPIAQYDLIDTVFRGPDPVGINGARFWRGNDTGLQHSFVDTTVQNGVRYYYAVVSYDMGDSTKLLQPTECPKIITEDFAGTLKFIDINCAIITPNAAAAGYVPPQVEGNLSKLTQGLGTGRMNVQLLDPAGVKEGYTYHVVFDAIGTVPKYKTASYNVLRIPATTTAAETLQSHVSAFNFGPGTYSSPFDGLAFSFTNDTVITINDTATGWVVVAGGGNPGVLINASFDHLNAALDVRWPADFELRWYANIVDTSFSLSPIARFPKLPVNFHVTDLTTGQTTKFLIDDADRSGSLSYGDTLRIVVGYVSNAKFSLAYQLDWSRGPGLNPPPPQDGDRWVLKTRRPYAQGDYFEFKTHAARSDINIAKDQMGKISVVPNPYIATASWERRTLYTTGRGDRKIDFIHLPQECTVRIYTVAGHLVKTLTKSSTATDGSLSWDLVSEDGMDIAYGLYVYHVDAPGIGERIGKFAVIK